MTSQCCDVGFNVLNLTVPYIIIYYCPINLLLLSNLYWDSLMSSVTSDLQDVK